MVPPGQHWQHPIHATDELIPVLEGALWLDVQGRVVQPALGQELLVPAGAHRSARTVGGRPTRWFYGHRSSLASAEVGSRFRGYSFDSSHAATGARRIPGHCAAVISSCKKTRAKTTVSRG